MMREFLLTVDQTEITDSVAWYVVLMEVNGVRFYHIHERHGGRD
jgi:hypothetical protein